MWYEVPKNKPVPYQRPKPIFPWELEREPQRPTRVFADDVPPEPVPAPTLAVSPPTAEAAGSNVTSGSEPKESKSTVGQREATEEGWQAFTQSANAWDSVPGIDNYVRAILGAQAKRSRPQPEPIPLDKVNEELLSPGSKDRQKSLVITDFPSALERPSLPVTPAPIRRPTFWGEERDEEGNLPAAEGVPDQTEWVCPQCGFSSASLSSFRAPSQDQQQSSSSRKSSSLQTSTADTLAQVSQSLATATLQSHKESAHDELESATTSAVGASSSSAALTLPPSSTNPGVVREEDAIAAPAAPAAPAAAL